MICVYESRLCRKISPTQFVGLSLLRKFYIVSGSVLDKNEWAWIDIRPIPVKKAPPYKKAPPFEVHLGAKGGLS